MCRVLGVSRSGFYASKTRPESARSKKDRQLVQEIKRVHRQSKGVYGSPKIRDELADAGISVGRHKVARLMRLERLRGCPKRRYRTTTQQDPRHTPAKNLLEQNRGVIVGTCPVPLLCRIHKGEICDAKRG